MKNRFIAALATIGAIASALVLPNAEPAKAQDDLVQVSIDETNLNLKSSGFGKLGVSSGNGNTYSECNVVGENPCGSDPYSLMADLNAPICKNAKSEAFCVGGLSALSPSGSRYKTVLRTVSETEIPAVAAYGTPKAGSAITATIGNQPILILVQALYVGNLQLKASGLPQSPGNKMVPMRVTAALSPFKWVDMATCQKDFPWGAALYIDEDNGRCAYAEDWPLDLKNTQFRLEVNLPHNSPKWGLGRVEKLTVSGAESNGHFAFNLEGYAATVSSYRDALPRNALINAGATWLSYGAKGLAGGGRNSLYVIDAATALGKERPTGRSTVWTVVMDTLDYSTYFWLGKTRDWTNFKECSRTVSSFVGFLTSNAIAYDPSPPALQEGAITFQAKDFHFDSQGTVKGGYFNFSMTNEFARCIFNLDANPNFASAKVQITDDKGQNVIALTTVSQDENWLRFSSSGFGYSTKFLNVSIAPASKLSQLRLFGSKLTAKASDISRLTKELSSLRRSKPQLSKLLCLSNFELKNLKLGTASTKSLCESIAKKLGGLSPRPKALPNSAPSSSMSVVDFILSN